MSDIIVFRGRRYLRDQLLDVIIENAMTNKYFTDAVDAIDKKRDRRNAIAAGIARRDAELVGLTPENYRIKREIIEKEVTEAL